jgi:glycerate dehydrogenase
MNIVVTDGYALNPGDLSWHPIEEHGDVTIHERTSPGELYDRCSNADIICTNKTPITKNIIDKLEHLKLITVLATGYNIIDIEAANNKGIIVTNVTGYGTASVAQHTFALILMFTNHTALHADAVAHGEWQRSPDWSFSKKPLTELAGKTLGIIGLGNIGQQTARIANAFGMKVIYHSQHDKNTTLAEYKDLHTVFSESDFISLHCPLTNENNQFVNTELLQQMKRSAYLINTARGQLINERDLADALNNNTIAGAVLDVLSKEPPDDNNPLLKAKNCIITPHNAWMTKEARQRIINITASNIKSFLSGAPQNVVSK